jgi:hypothetical protein
VLASAFAALLCCAPATIARAEPAASTAEAVALDVPDCLDAPGADVAKLVALELAPRLRVVSAGDRAQALLTATVACPPGERARLSVEDPTRSTPLRVELDLARTAPRARTRLLALTLAELIATSRLERSASAQPSTLAAAAAAASASASAAEGLPAIAAHSARGGLRMWLAPGFSRAGAPGTMLFGVDGGVGHRFGLLVLGLELQGRWGQASLDEAEVAMRMFSAAVTATPPIALGRQVELLLGPGLRAGYARLSARSLRADLDGGTLDGAFLGPIGIAAAHLGISRYSALRLAFEAGYAARSLIGNAADSSELLAVRGLWLSATIGLALQL